MSDFIYEQGEAVDVGIAGEHDYEFAGGGSDCRIGVISGGTYSAVQSDFTVSRSCANQWAVWKLEVVGDSITLYTKAPGGTYTQEGSWTDTTITSAGAVGGTVNVGGTSNNDYEGQLDNYDIRPASSFLTTATKSLSSSRTVDLQNLSYNLRDGGIILDVIGSPGTASEEIVSQTLDGASSYTLSWSNTHQDYRVKVNMSMSDVTLNPPSVSTLEVQG